MVISNGHKLANRQLTQNLLGDVVKNKWKTFVYILFTEVWHYRGIRYVMRSNKMSLKSKNMIFVLWYFILGYCLGFNLVKIPQRLDNWFQRYKQLMDWTNNKKQKKLSALIGCILKTVFASSDSFASSHHIYSCKFPNLWVGKISAKIKNWGRNTGDNNKIYVCMNGEEIQQFDETDGEKMSTFWKIYTPTDKIIAFHNFKLLC